METVPRLSATEPLLSSIRIEITQKGFYINDNWIPFDSVRTYQINNNVENGSVYVYVNFAYFVPAFTSCKSISKLIFKCKDLTEATRIEKQLHASTIRYRGHG